ncbi:efflux RND transporter periplasmic adaptor subunit [Rhodohalobacter sp. SW132]|uniref:efflux RND transporter periplasmic adaptor subunit n=1 Tax=Rhodohalobacter sp. SW132 TaxID=2293433 RepID=UPI000E21ED82|nr:efflux RND transporter periplasmic adaptor subunit [Rhodohalobacter sp. SW132]REL38256.1 efflux RND transporter periplasmic adaptor subunit [Rhodohalobacter sp. SW132]
MGKQQSATKKLLKILGILVVLIIAGGVLANLMGWMDGGENEKSVTSAEAELRTITQIVSASGRIQPEVEVIIRPDVSGEVIELNVREGDFVREGDLLLRIKPDIYQARIDELNAMLLTQQSRMEQARSTKLQAEIEYQKNKQLYDRDLISELEFMQSENNFESQKSNFKAAEYQIESARAQLRRAEEELQQTVIRSPKDGTISRLNIERGERVLGNAQTAGTEMMRIARLNQMEVEVEVNENDIVNVSVDDTTDIEVDAYPNRSFLGRVTEIANSADITGTGSAEQITNYKVKIRITTPHNLNAGPEAQIVQVSDQESPAGPPSPIFKPGMSGTVDIRTNTAVDVVAVPIQAVTVRDFAGESADSDTTGSETTEQKRSSGSDEDFRRVVFLNDNGVAKRVEVETGISDNTHIQILNGVRAGDEVITGSYRVLSRDLNNGDAIRVTNSQQLASN